jgi:putative ABC transport system permease protein
VVGVMPASVKLFDPAGVQGWDNGFSKSDLWRPLPVASGLQKQRNYRAFLVLGRLKPNVSIAQAQADMAQLARREAQDYPDSSAGWTIKVRSWHSTVVRNVRLPLMLLWGAVSLVMLIATANLANLSIARAASRQKEFGIRLALGAGRFRLARQLLAESLLLSGLGGATGLLLARWGISLVIRLIPQDVPRLHEIGLDARVLAFTLASSLLVGLLFGLAPLLTISGRDMNGSLKPESRGSTGSIGGRQLRGLLVTSEVALVVVLLTGAGLLIRSFRYLNDVNPGFRPDHLVALDVSIGGPGYTNEFHRIQFVQQLLTRLSELAGVESSAAVDGLPLDVGRGTMDIALTSIEGSPPATPDRKLVAGLHLVSPEYFRTMSIPLTRGRSFTDRDNTNAPSVVIINEALARRCFAGRSPIGQRIGSPDFGSQLCEIVGVINDVKNASMDETPKPEVFRPLLQECFSGMTIVARSVSVPNQTFAALRDAIIASDRSSPSYNPRTLDHLVSASLALRRFAFLLMALFAGLALSLAVVGIYGVLSWVVSERVREIGIRLALGAQRRQVLRMILTQGMRPVAIGGLIGIAGVWPLTRLLRSLLYAVSPTDPFTLFAVALLLNVVAVAACWLPARRAANTDPILALRHE